MGSAYKDPRGEVTGHLELATAVAGQWYAEKEGVSAAVHATHIALHLLQAAYAIREESSAIFSFMAREMDGVDTAKIINSADVFARTTAWNISDAIRLCILLPAAARPDMEQHLKTLCARVADAAGCWRGVTDISMPGGRELTPGVYQ